MKAIASSAIVAQADGFWDWAVLFGAIIGVGIVLALVWIWIRRRFRPGADPGPSEPGFTIESLEAMRRDGRISDEEFRTLRAAVLGLPSRPAESDNKGLSETGPSDDEEPETPGTEGDPEDEEQE